MQITEITAAYIDSLLKQFAANPKQNWKQKDAAIYLITALAVSSSTQVSVPVFDYLSKLKLAPHEYIHAEVVKGFWCNFSNHLP